MVRVTVLKSLRTQAGAEDWLRIMKSQFPEAKVMHTDALKMFPEVAYTVDPTGFSNHIVIEEDLTPVIERVKEGDIGGLVSAFLDKGYARIESYGFCFTEKWDLALKEFLEKAFEKGLDAYKSTNKVEVPEAFHKFMEAAEGVLKSLGIPSVPENNETGAEPEPATPISDEEASAAAKTHTPAKPADVADCLDKEAISDDETKAENQEITKKAVEEDEDGEEEETEEEDSPVGEVFKSLAEARSWKNPDVSRYYTDPMTFEEKKLHGIRYSFIVREKAPHVPVGAFGNRKV